jgi:hypothetical protein
VITSAAVKVHAGIGLGGIIAENGFGSAEGEKNGFEIVVAELSKALNEGGHVDRRWFRRLAIHGRSAIREGGIAGLIRKALQQH